MSAVRILTLTFLLVSALSAPGTLHSQGLAYGHLGTAWDETIGTTTIDYGAGLVWPLFPESQSAARGIGLTFEFSQSTGFPERTTRPEDRTTLTGGVAYQFPLAPLFPFVSVGAGITSYSPQAMLVGTVSAGLKVALSDHWRFLPRFRVYKELDRTPLPGSNAYLYEASAGIGYEW